MKKVLLVGMALGLAAMGMAAEIRGNYIEARNADVYVAHCFAMSEVGLTGDLALLGWQIEKGAFNNVTLDGLSAVAVVKASHTLGDPFKSAYPAKAVLILDEKANLEQRQALQGFVEKMAGDLVQTVTRVEVAPIRFDFNGNLHAGVARMEAGNLAKIETRELKDGDAVCHNAFTYYPPLTKLDHAMPVHTVENRYAGAGLNTNWSSPDKNSAFVGTFVTRSE
jgi:hypothetical protein